MIYYSFEELASKIKEIRKNHRIVMVPGTFDLFHKGHLNIILKAKESPDDFLIVVVKSDKAAALKKKHEPIISERDRAIIVSSIKGVDAAIIADYDETREIAIPRKLSYTPQYQWLNIFEPAVRIIKPDVFVHNDNLELRDIRGYLFAKYGVTGKICNRTEGISSTDIINKILEVYNS